MTSRFDYVLVGGGLQSGLMALAIRAHRPDARIALIERGPTLGGNHTWCFHDGDLSAAERGWIDPLVVHRWTSYEVAFPEHRRVLDSGYACVTSERLHPVVRDALARPGSALLLGATATAVGEHAVAVRTGEGERILAADLVVDARGPEIGDAPAGGFQIFVGLEVRTAAPHGLVRPMLMDATIAQVGGFRFLYVLPLGDDRLLIEDTCYADHAFLDVEQGRQACRAHAAARGWTIAEVLREESGVLPLPFDLEVPTPTRGPLVAGYQGGWFHPVTGYSFPLAARLAGHVARRAPDAIFDGALADLVARHRRQLGFALRLNRMLFRWFPPDQRHHVLARFYRLAEPTIRRFYALELTALDKARIFVGRPPRGLSWRAVSPAREAS